MCIPSLFIAYLEFTYYDTNPVGSLIVKNYEKQEVKNIEITFYVERYMDNPMSLGKIARLESEEERKVNIYGMFTEDLLSITEGTKASAKFTITYRDGADDIVKEYNPVLEFYNRNALTWDDDRKVSAFVTAKDPAIMTFAKNITTWIHDAMNPSIDENFQTAMAVFEGVRNYGVRYQIDPITPFSDFSENKTAVDFLQFPKQTLQFTSGDCDDLSVLYISLLEAVGIETAVITIPGHIYSAFALKKTPDEARKVFSATEDLIFIDEKVWVPVETTFLQGPFDRAWQAGAKQWRENYAKGHADFYTIREAWNLYKPVGFEAVGSGDRAESIHMPDRNKVVEDFSAGMIRHVEREIYPQVVKLQKKIQDSQNNIRYRNQLGVVYARYGLYNKAESIFEQILLEADYLPAFVNFGNIRFINDNYADALRLYQRALDIGQNNATALLGVARCSHELENYGLAAENYQALKEIDPNLAMRFGYLEFRGEEAMRAADAAGAHKVLVWEEEN